jgi:hypothetical protein
MRSSVWFDICGQIAITLLAQEPICRDSGKRLRCDLLGIFDIVVVSVYTDCGVQ